MKFPITSACLKLDFLEQQSMTYMHCNMSILIIRGRHDAMKSQVRHYLTAIVKNI